MGRCLFRVTLVRSHREASARNPDHILRQREGASFYAVGNDVERGNILHGDSRACDGPSPRLCPAKSIGFLAARTSAFGGRWGVVVQVTALSAEFLQVCFDRRCTSVTDRVPVWSSEHDRGAWGSGPARLRLDAGFRIIDWQRADGSRESDQGANMFPFTSTPGALHPTIGHSF
jgi:hypothetical protein